MIFILGLLAGSWIATILILLIMGSSDNESYEDMYEGFDETK